MSASLRRVASGALSLLLSASCSYEDPATSWSSSDGGRDAEPVADSSLAEAEADGAGDVGDVSLPPTTYRASRQLVMSNLADPDVFKVSDDLYLLTGTGSTTSFQIYESHDLQSFTPKVVYDPSALPGSQHDYCYLWAPELWKDAQGKYRLAFSAHRVGKGQPCPPSNQEVTTFYAVADDLTLQFGAPLAFDHPAGQPRTTTEPGCPADGCVNAIRIDSAVWGVQDPWLFYVWFQAGNHIASFPLNDPQIVIRNVDPGTPWEGEESINEAPDVFEREGKLYLFFSAGHFLSNYSMHYVMGDSIQELRRPLRGSHRLTTALRNAGGKLLENSGHSSMTSRHGQHHLFYHVGTFTNGALTARHTYRKPVFFNPDRRLMSLDAVRFRWSRLEGHEYSLDLKPVGKDWVGPCVSVAHLGTDLSTTYRGICADGDVVIPKDEIEAARLYYSPVGSGVWNQYAEASYDGFSDDLEIPLPGGRTEVVTLHWNQQKVNAGYSLDIKLKGKDWIAPCVAGPTLTSELEYDFDGACKTGPSAGSSFALADIEQFRVCSAVDGNWASATCTTADYDGKAMVDWLLFP